MASKRTDSVDMISNLPDDILHLIFSRVPITATEELVRTSILSRRWRHLWTSAPSIDIDYSRGLKPDEEFNKNKFEEFVCRVLENQSMDLDSFRLCCGFWYPVPMSTIGPWIEAAVRRKVKLIDLDFCTRGGIVLPDSLLTCPSLEVLRLSLNTYRLNLPKCKCFPALRVLELNSCTLLSDDSVKEFLKSCPVLEDLSLVDCVYDSIRFLCISCPNLKSFKIDNRKSDNQRRQEDEEQWEYGVHGICNQIQIRCPKLVFLEFACFISNYLYFTKVDSLKEAVIHPQDSFMLEDSWICDLFDNISHVESLSLRICLVDDYILLDDFPESLPNLKTLEITASIDADIMEVLIRILTCSPNLESLHVTFEEGSIYASCPPEVPNFDFSLMECTFKEVKMVKVRGISPVPYHMGFIQFLFESSPVLETMTINPNMNLTDEKLRFLTDDLMKFSRASPQAEIIFVQDQV